MDACAALCFKDSKCKFWTYNPRSSIIFTFCICLEVTTSIVSYSMPRVQKCWLKTSGVGKTASTKGSFSGQKACGAPGNSVSFFLNILEKRLVFSSVYSTMNLQYDFVPEL